MDSADQSYTLFPVGTDVVKRGTLVRVMSPAGLYWAHPFKHPTALYSPNSDLVFAACQFDDELHRGDYYTEFDDPKIEEMRLYAALQLSIGWDGGEVCLYPHPRHIVIPEKLDLSSGVVEAELRARVCSHEFENEFRLKTDPPTPLIYAGQPYDFRHSATPSNLQKLIYDKIEVSDYVLLRGLNAWIKAKMLRCHQQFYVEALYSMYVSLDASFSLIRRKLEKQGVTNPSAVDAGRFLDEAEGRKPSGYPYFGEFYSNRIELIHPENRFGVTPYPPGMADDLLFLNQSLREVYRFLILDEIVDPKNFVEV